MEHLHSCFDYDHDEGCLRWKALDNDSVIIKPNGKIETNISSKSRVKAGSIAGRVGFGDYKIKQYGQTSCGLRAIWQYVTGDIVLGKIRTMHPRETRFSIDNLYVVSHGASRVHKDRAKSSTVISFCYERKQFTVVDVDQDYNRVILSYHNDMDSASEALKNPEVSFL